MAKTARQVRETIKKVDLVIEVRDARIPFSSANPIIDEIFKSKTKKRVLVFNKAELANSNLQQKIREIYEEDYQRVVFTTAKPSKNKNRSPKRILQQAVSLVPKSISENGIRKVYTMLVVGVPNVGKSTIINALRLLSGKKKSAKTGASPGVTRAMSGFSVCDLPPIYLVDTPGVMLPGNLISTGYSDEEQEDLLNVEERYPWQDPDAEAPAQELSYNQRKDLERALKLALIGALPDDKVGLVPLAEYLLFTLNRFRSREYLAFCGLKEPEESVRVVLSAIMKRMGCPEDVAAQRFIAKFRKGELGQFTLDEITPESALAIASSTTGMTLLQANLEHARRVKKREKLEARRTVLATRIVAAQREAAKLLAAQRRDAEKRIAGDEAKKRIHGKGEGEGRVLQIESGEEGKGVSEKEKEKDEEDKKIVLTDEIRNARRARGRAVITLANKKAGEEARERRVIELAKSMLRPLPALPPEPKHRRKNK
eukprot:Phypoly_transcript_05994.p1 GENE.Phypoly_transcript_05994~~Phypoly_transcript_05994.p1  ORF type:complete len:543 (+),score=132.89 Phypoly_transcript_05994:180-1631(+)